MILILKEEERHTTGRASLNAAEIAVVYYFNDNVFRVIKNRYANPPLGTDLTPDQFLDLTFQHHHPHINVETCILNSEWAARVEMITKEDTRSKKEDHIKKIIEEERKIEENKIDDPISCLEL